MRQNGMDHRACSRGCGALSARNLQTPSEGPAKLGKACRRCIRGSCSAMAGEETRLFHQALLLSMPILLFLPAGLDFESALKMCFTFL